MIERPDSEAGLAEVIRAAAGPLRVQGGGTRWFGPAGEDAAVVTTGLRGVVLYEPAALTLVVRAGTALAEVEALLAAEGQRLGFEPGDWRGVSGRDGRSTIGGVVAENVSGPRRVQAGACRDALIGVRFVDGSGAVTASGGRVMKNVTGYDLVKLLAGSRGRLGVLSEVALKVQPVPPAEATVILELALEATGAAMAAALGSPFEVSGAAFVAGQGALFRVEGLAGSVAGRAAGLGRLLAGFGPVRHEADAAASRAIWAAVRDLAPLAGLPGDMWRFSLRPSQGPAVAARLGGPVLLDWGGGCVWARLPAGADGRAIAAPFQGHARRFGGGGPVPADPPEPPAVAALTAGLRRAFDPRGIFAGEG